MADTLEAFRARRRKQQQGAAGQDTLEAFRARRRKASAAPAPQPVEIRTDATVEQDMSDAAPARDTAPQWTVLTSPEGQQRRFRALNTADEFATKDLLLGLPAHTKFDAAGQASFLNEKLGRGSAWIDDEGSVFVLTPEERQKPLEEQVPMVLNRPGLSLGDVAYAPEIVSGVAAGAVAPALAAGAGVLGMFGAGAAAGAGAAVARQAAGAALPGEEQATLGERALDVGASALFEGAFAPGVPSAAVSKTVGPITRKLKEFLPSQYFARAAKATEGTPDTIEAAKGISERQGIDFTVGDMSGSSRVQEFETFTAGLPGGGGMREALSNRMKQIEDLGRKTIDKLAPAERRKAAAAAPVRLYQQAQQAVYAEAENLRKTALGPRTERATRDVVDSYLGKVDSLIDRRQKLGNNLFNEAAAEAGDAAVFSPSRTINEIDNLIMEFRSGASGTSLDIGEANKLVGHLETIKESLTTPASTDPKTMMPRGAGVRNMSVTEMKNALSSWSSKAARPHTTMQDIADFSTKKHVNRRIFGALMDDLGDLAEQGVPGAGKLKQAREFYRDSSKQIRELQDHPMKAFIDKPEKLIDEVLKVRNSERSRGIVEMIGKVAPEHLESFQEAYVSSLLSKVADITKPSQVGKALKQYEAQTEIVLGGNKKLMKRVRNLNVSARRLEKFGGDMDAYIKEPKKLLDNIASGNYPSTTKRIMRYMRAADPEAAEALGAAGIEAIFRKSIPTLGAGFGADLNLAQAARALQQNMETVEVLAGGNKEVVQMAKDFIDSMRLTAGSGRRESATQRFQTLEKILVSGPKLLVAAGAASAAGGAPSVGLGTALTGAAGAVGTAVLARVLSGALTDTTVLKALTTAAELGAKKDLTPTARRQLSKALFTIGAWKARRPGMWEEEDGGAPQQDLGAASFAAEGQ